MATEIKQKPQGYTITVRGPVPESVPEALNKLYAEAVAEGVYQENKEKGG